VGDQPPLPWAPANPRPRHRRGSLQESCLWASANPRPRRRQGSLQGSRRPDGLCGARAAPAARLVGKRPSSHPRPTRARSCALPRSAASARRVNSRRPRRRQGPHRARRLPDGLCAARTVPAARRAEKRRSSRPTRSRSGRPPRPKPPLRPPKPRRRPRCGARLPCDANGARASSSGLTAPLPTLGPPPKWSDCGRV